MWLSSQVWSFGVFLCEAVLLKPIEDWFPGERKTMLAFGYTPELQDGVIAKVKVVSPRFGALVRRIFEWDVAVRLSAEEVVSHLKDAWASS